MEFTIRDAEPALIPQIEALEKRCFSLPWTQEQLRGQLRDAQHEFLAALDPDDGLLGYVGMLYVLDEGYISNVAVEPDCRCTGVGDALIEALEARCVQHGLSFATLEVREGNLPARALYEKHGFENVGRRKAYYDRPKEDAILMTKFWNRGTELENTGI